MSVLLTNENMIALNWKSHQRGFGFGSDIRCWRWWSLYERRTEACVKVRDAGFFCALIESNRLYRGRKCNLQSLQMGQCPTRPHKPGLSGATPESATFSLDGFYFLFLTFNRSNEWSSSIDSNVHHDRQSFPGLWCQWLTHSTFNRGDGGSNPPGPIGFWIRMRW